MHEHDSSRSRSESRRRAQKERKNKDKKEEKRDKGRDVQATSAFSSAPVHALVPDVASPMPPAIDGAAILGAINGLDARFAKQLGDIGADVSCVKSDVGVVRGKVDVLFD